MDIRLSDRPQSELRGIVKKEGSHRSSGCALVKVMCVVYSCGSLNCLCSSVRVIGR